LRRQILDISHAAEALSIPRALVHVVAFLMAG